MAQTNKELNYWIAKPVCLHKQVAESIEHLVLLLSLREHVNGHKFQPYNEETSINGVNATVCRLRQNENYYSALSKVFTWQ
jgi:hypothetical protein